jgi:hypothetical protein
VRSSTAVFGAALCLSLVAAALDDHEVRYLGEAAVALIAVRYPGGRQTLVAVCLLTAAALVACVAHLVPAPDFFDMSGPGGCPPDSRAEYWRGQLAFAEAAEILRLGALVAALIAVRGIPLARRRWSGLAGGVTGTVAGSAALFVLYPLGKGVLVGALPEPLRPVAAAPGVLSLGVAVALAVAVARRVGRGPVAADAMLALATVAFLSRAMTAVDTLTSALSEAKMFSTARVCSSAVFTGALPMVSIDFAKIGALAVLIAAPVLFARSFPLSPPRDGA